MLPIFVPRTLEVRRPQHARDVDEERIVSQLLSHANTPPKPIRDMTLLIRLRRAGQRFSVLVEVSLRSELVSVVAEYGTVVVAVPYVGYAHGALRDERALVPVVFARGVGHAERYGGTPAKDFFEDCADVWEARCVGEGWETVTADYGVQFDLRSALHLWKGYHSERPPAQSGRGRFSAGTTAMLRISSCRIRNIYMNSL